MLGWYSNGLFRERFNGVFQLMNWQHQFNDWKFQHIHNINQAFILTRKHIGKDNDFSNQTARQIF